MIGRKVKARSLELGTQRRTDVSIGIGISVGIDISLYLGIGNGSFKKKCIVI